MLKVQIESLLFVSTKPVSIKDLVRFFKNAKIKAGKKEIAEALDELISAYNAEESGIHIINVEEKYQMVSSPANKELVEKLIKQDRTGELTQPSIETLTIVAYRGPISKIELEQIRGVNCSMILRNLMIRGLVDIKTDKVSGQELYHVTPDFLQHLGLNKVDELPDFAKLHQIESLNNFLGKREESQAQQ